MRTLQKLVAGATIFFSLVLFTPIVWAEEELPYDLMTCGSGTTTMISSSEELTVFFAESKGITISNPRGGWADNSTYHCGGVTRVSKEKVYRC